MSPRIRLLLLIVGLTGFLFLKERLTATLDGPEVTALAVRQLETSDRVADAWQAVQTERQQLLSDGSVVGVTVLLVGALFGRDLGRLCARCGK